MTVPVKIRLYEDSDARAVAALWKEIFPDQPAHNVPEEDIARKQAHDHGLFFVAELDSAIVGTAMGGYDGHRGWVYLVAVKERLRGAGLGARLMAAVETALRQLGCRKLNLQVRAGNEAVIRFYERLGFEQEPRASLGKRLDDG